MADVHDFPSSDSQVVASVGFIDDDEVGFFWSAVRGDSVEETFADTLASVDSAKWEFDVVRNTLLEPLEWDLLINGTVVGSFSLDGSDVGPQVLEFDFPPVAAVGGEYTVRIEATSTVGAGLGSHTLRYDLAGPHQITLGEGGGGGTGADIRIDLSTLVSTTPGNWNNVSNVAGLTPDLIDFNTGAPTGVSINGNSTGWRPFFADDAGAFAEQDWVIQPSTVDGAGIDRGVTGVYTVAGLTGSSYRIEVVSARTCCDYLNTFTVQGDLADRTFLGTPVVTPWGSLTHGLTPSNWLIWDGVVPAGGEIRIQNAADPGTLGVLNALRILEEDGDCFADCDGNGELDFFDFLCFQNDFAAGDPAADCDGNGELDFFDFLCFQNAFAAGCP